MGLRIGRSRVELKLYGLIQEVHRSKIQLLHQFVSSKVTTMLFRKALVAMALMVGMTSAQSQVVYKV